MKVSQIGFLLLFALFVQTTFMRLITNAFIPFDVVFIAIVFIALFRGAVVGIVVGSIGGLLQDILSGGIIGVNGLVKSTIGLLVGLTATRFIVDTLWYRLALLFVASLMSTLFFLMVYGLLLNRVQSIAVDPLLSFDNFLYQATANMIVGGLAELLFYLIKNIRKRSNKISRRSFIRREWIMN